MADYISASLYYIESDFTPEQHEELIALMKTEGFDEMESGYGWLEARNGQLPEAIVDFFKTHKCPFSWEVTSTWDYSATIELFDGNKSTEWYGDGAIHMLVENAFDVVRLMEAGEALKLHKRIRAKSLPY